MHFALSYIQALALAVLVAWKALPPLGSPLFTESNLSSTSGIP